eukprot:TRINITY_DN5030_c0_g1_i2.p1 TRINITY_DN5030_c0_g1~~TRINITY_DN5030_c0_g1_i2.p1  ORF type:complete len:287 (+),score=40.98 TRINITY_DN5030_c0_g1_i2:32-862(+)
MLWDDEEQRLDVEAELHRLDLEGRSLDFDEIDREESLGASLCAITFFISMQIVGLALIYTQISHTFIILSLTTNIMYFRLVWSDPGRLPRGPSRTQLRQEVLFITDQLPEDMKQTGLCRYCRAVKPPRAKHCHRCGVCVAKFDHHCFWLNNCIGAGNHRLFLIFVVTLTWWLGWADVYLLRALRKAPQGLSQYLVATVTAVGIGMLLFSVPLSIGHVMFASANITTFEFSRPQKAFYLPPSGRNIFDKGFVANATRFCCVTSFLPKEDYLPVIEWV